MMLALLLILMWPQAADGVGVANDAVSGVSIQTLVIFLLGSSAFTTGVSYWLSRRKHAADALKLEAEADNIVAKTFNEVIETLRTQLRLQEQSCATRIAEVEEDNRRKYAGVVERLNYLEEREEQATSHIKNLEKMLRDLGVPLPPTPWRPRHFRRKNGRGNHPGNSRDSSG